MDNMQHQPVVLVVDDNPYNLQLVAGLIGETQACDICFATGGEEALEVIESVAPDLVLLDINMPGMDGYQVCEAIRASPSFRETPVIFLAAHRDPEFIVKGFEAGGTDYVSKPFENRELAARVKVQLELKLKRDELKRRNEDLEAAINRIKRLEGILPICMYCKKIRNDGDSWQQLERYISENSDAVFSHGICPDCYAEQCIKLEIKP